MNIINYEGSKMLFGDPGETIFTNAIVDAIDTATTSTDIYPYAYSATLQNQFDERNFRSLATDVDIAISSRIAFGLFLADTTETGNTAKKNVILSMRGSHIFNTEALASIRAYYIFGRCSASTVTSTTAATANLLSEYIVIPERAPVNRSYMATSTPFEQRGACSEDIVKIAFGGTGYPLFFGLVIENLSPSTAYNFDQLVCSLSFQIWDQPLQAYRVKGV